MIDRSEVDYQFDGMTARIVIEDQTESGQFIELVFSRVAFSSFESFAVLDDYPSEISEKIVKSSVPIEFLERAQSDVVSHVFDGIECFRFFLEDYGAFVIYACSVEINRI